MKQTALDNFDSHIVNNTYPGRGLVIGRSESGTAWHMIYWIMGRSANSRNRQFEALGTEMSTIPFDASQVEDPSLIIYEAILEYDGKFIITNGDQTRTIIDTMKKGGSFDEALFTREREPDAPNYTPRISMMLDPDAILPITMSILKANKFDPENTDRNTFRPAPPEAGYGYCITTYMGDGNPIPSFMGDPIVLPMMGSAKTVLQTYWNALDADNKVALAVKTIHDDGTIELRIKNKYE